MEQSKLQLITAVLDILAGLCFIFLAVMKTGKVSRILFAVAAVCFLIAGILSMCTYIKNRGKEDKK